MDTLDFPDEIIQLVLESKSCGVTILHQADLGRLALTCKRLSVPATNTLYRSIQYNFLSKDVEIFDRLHRSVADNPGRAARVREVCLTWLDVDDKIRGKVFEFLRTTPFITKLSLRLHPILPLDINHRRALWRREDASCSPTRLLLQCSLTYLETLFIHDPLITSNELRECAILPTLKHMTVGRYNPEISKDLTIPLFYPEVVAPFRTGLESLTVQSCPSTSNSFLKAMFNGASSLTIFACRFEISTRGTKVRAKSISDALAPVRTTLRELHLVGTMPQRAFHSNRTTVDLSNFSALRSLKIRDVLFFPRGTTLLPNNTESLSIYQILPPPLESLQVCLFNIFQYKSLPRFTPILDESEVWQIYSDYETCKFHEIFIDPSNFGYRWLLELAQNKAFFLPSLDHVEIDQDHSSVWPVIEWDYPAQVLQCFREAKISLSVLLRSNGGHSHPPSEDHAQSV